MRAETLLDPDHEDRRPFPPLRGMEGEHLHARHIADAEGIDGGEPRPQRRAVTVGLLAQEVDEYLADPSGGGAVVLGVRLAGGIGIELVEEVVGEGAESGGRLTALGAVEEPALDRARRQGASTDDDAAGLERLGDTPRHLMGAREDRDLTPTDRRRVAAEHRGRDPRCLSILVRVGGEAQRSGILTGRDQAGPLTRGVEHVIAGRDDLRGRTVVHREADHLDAREAPVHIHEQGGIGSVEAVDRLRGVTDEEQVIAALSEHIHETVLEGVEVLGLVDVEMTEPPPHGLGERTVALQLADEDGQQVVEVDHTAPTLLLGVGVEGRGHLRHDPGASTGRARRALVVIGSEAPRERPVDLLQHRRRATSVTAGRVGSW